MAMSAFYGDSREKRTNGMSQPNAGEIYKIQTYISFELSLYCDFIVGGFCLLPHRAKEWLT